MEIYTYIHHSIFFSIVIFLAIASSVPKVTGRYVFQSLASGKKILILATIIIIIKNLSVLMVKNRISLKKKKTLCRTL